MKATQRLHELGQSLWLDNITRDLQDEGAKAFVASWKELMAVLGEKSAELK